MKEEIQQSISTLNAEINGKALLIAVSKTKPVDMLQAAYDAGVRDFGENYVQELCDKQPLMPLDIRWHFIGHLQSNKVKYIAPFVHCIHAVDSEKLLREIEKQAAKNNRRIHCLLQLHIAKEESKFGWDSQELIDFANTLDVSAFPHIIFSGLMGMASFTNDEQIIRSEFSELKSTFDSLKHQVFNEYPDFRELSMGMSSDFRIALEYGSTMVRVGSTIFGHR